IQEQIRAGTLLCLGRTLRGDRRYREGLASYSQLAKIDRAGADGCYGLRSWGYSVSVALPLFLPVRQNFPDRSLKDIPGTVQKELSSSGLASRLAPGARVAVAVGSRGIANIAEIVGAVVGFWKSAGFRPFIFPAMGSHG